MNKKYCFIMAKAFDADGNLIASTKLSILHLHTYDIDEAVQFLYDNSDTYTKCNTVIVLTRCNQESETKLVLNAIPEMAGNFFYG